jgi:hypothetical protein
MATTAMSIPLRRRIGVEGARALEPYVSWAEPWYGPADSLANLSRRRFIWAGTVLLFLSTFAVLAVALSATEESMGRAGRSQPPRPR